MTFENGFPIAAGCTLVALLLMVGHWFPWPRFLGREMYRLEAYVYGTGSIFVGFALTGWLYEMLWPVAWLGAIMVSGGLAVFVSYGVDYVGVKLAANRRRERSASRNAVGEQS